MWTVKLLRHICRMRNNHLLKMLMFWMVEGDRRPGRPASRWTDILKWCNKDLNGAALSFFLSYACHGPQLISQETASSSVERSRDKLPVSFVRGQFRQRGTSSGSRRNDTDQCL